MGMLAIFIGILFFALAWKWPRVALWITIFAIPLYIVRFEIGGVPTTLLEIFIYSSWLAWGCANYKTLWQSIRQVYQPIWGGLLFLGVGLMLGVVASVDIFASLGIVKGWFIGPLLLYFLIIKLVDANKISNYITALLLSSLGLSGFAIWQALTQNFITIDGRASAWFTSANYLSLYLVPVLLLGLIVGGDLDKRKKLLTLVAWLVGLGALYFSFSYGGWLTLILAGLAWGFIFRRYYWKWLLGGLVVPVALFVSQLGSERFTSMLDISTRSSISVRFQVWQTALLMIRENWETGIGLGQFQANYLKYANRVFESPFETHMLHSHNLFFQFLIETGIFGLFGFIWILIFHIKQLVMRFSGPAGVLAITLGAMLVHGLVDVSYWKNDLSAIFWLVLALIVVWNRQGTKKI
jgi:O-antigen ligase